MPNKFTYKYEHLSETMRFLRIRININKTTMRYVESGKGRVPLMTLIAILSISLTVNLPGLAISPIMGKIAEVFPTATEFETQLLTVLPNLLIIPFMLLSGHLAVRHSESRILTVGLVIYCLSAVLYLFSDSMLSLLLISCLLGVGSGLVVPLAGGYIGEYFTGKARARFLGMKSGISNASIILGTLAVGLIANRNWHLPFLVYLVPIIPLLLVPYLRRDYILKHTVPTEEPEETQVTEVKKPTTPAFSAKQSVKLLACIIAIYFSITYGMEVISYFLPFTFTHYHLSDSQTGIATSVFFLACTLGGFGLQPITKVTGRFTMPVFLAMMAVSLLGLGIFHSFTSFLVTVFFLGLGYGVIQPVIYNKATEIAPTPQDSSRYFSYVLTANYVAISVTPAIIEGLGDLMHQSANTNFPYILNGIILCAVTVIAIIYRKSFPVKV